MEKNNFESYIIELSKAFKKFNVEYMIVGGTAVALYGYARMTMQSNGLPAPKFDIDLWFNPTYENYYNLLSALDELEIEIGILKDDKAPNPRNSYLRFETSEYTLDILPKLLSNERFNISYERRMKVEIDGSEIDLIGYSDLINEKRKTGREKDLNDIDELSKIHNESAS